MNVKIILYDRYSRNNLKSFRRLKQMTKSDSITEIESIILVFFQCLKRMSESESVSVIIHISEGLWLTHCTRHLLLLSWPFHLHSVGFLTLLFCRLLAADLCVLAFQPSVGKRMMNGIIIPTIKFVLHSIRHETIEIQFYRKYNILI